ncbi:MAG: sugar phosphate isomerase/epimerase family protein [Thermoproteota archaeon]
MIKNPKIGIMQGRLSRPYDGKIQSFPISSWREEFEKASSCGFEVMEWVFDIHVPNPILSSDGISEIRSLCMKHGIMINSVCADYFMEKKLFQESESELEKNRETLKKLILQAAKLEAPIIEIPFVDSSSLKTTSDKIELKNNLDKVIPIAEKNGVFIVLETDLPPLDFRELLLRFNHPNVLANYDSGNSASLGYNSREELTTLKKWIKNIHVKDRKFKGGTVPLGSGDTNFDLFFSTLSEIQYSGDLIIQGARLPDNEFTPESTCSMYHKFVKEYVDKYYS